GAFRERTPIVVAQQLTGQVAVDRTKPIGESVSGQNAGHLAGTCEIVGESRHAHVSFVSETSLVYVSRARSARNGNKTGCVSWFSTKCALKMSQELQEQERRQCRSSRCKGSRRRIASFRKNPVCWAPCAVSSAANTRTCTPSPMSASPSNPARWSLS